MEARDYFRMIRGIKSCSVATVDASGRPQTRIIDIMVHEDDKLYFVTARGKEFHKELMKRKELALVAMNSDYQMIRINSKVKKLKDQRIFNKVFNDNPNMNEMYPGDTKDILDVFCIYDGSGEFFDLSRLPLYRQDFCFGKGRVERKGFLITNKCTKCGLCKNNCPQSCILEGDPYYIIDQHKCLHCGLCFEKCPDNAIDNLYGNKI